MKKRNVLISVTRIVNEEYKRFIEKYVKGRRKRFRPYKIYIFLIVRWIYRSS